MSYINQRKYLSRKFFGIYKPITSPAYDSDAQAYFNVNTSITSSADKTAINNFYLGLKSDGIYSKLKAMYLPIWGSATPCKWNLVNNRSFDASFSMGFTYSSGGITGNGTSAYVDVNFIPSANVTQNSFAIGFYSRTSRADNNLPYAMGVVQTIPNANAGIRLKFSTNLSLYYCNDVSGQTLSTTDSRGFYQSSRINATQLYYGRNTYNTGTYNSTGVNSIKIYVFARNNNGSIQNYETVQSSFFYLGSGLSLTEMANFYTRVQALMTYFGINV